MILPLLPALLLPGLLLPPGPPHPQKAEAPRWIWITETGQTDQHAYFTRHIEIRENLLRAQLEGSCDNSFELFVNGKRVLENDEWQVALSMDACKLLKPGDTNLIAIHGWNEGGPAGMWFKLGLEYEDGTRETVVSDATWTVRGEATESWSASGFAAGPRNNAVALGALGDAPWGMPLSTVDNLPPRALDPEALELPAGFQAELIYNVPRETHGSWVSMTNAPGGRLFVGDQYGGLYRVTPSPPGSGEEGTLVEPIEFSVGQAQGLLWAFDSLYVVGGTAGKNAGLYRLTDTNDDGQLDSSRLLRPLEGYGEHGPHAIRLGPDGESLYVVAGNMTKLPEIVRSRVPRVWAEDQLLPRLPDPRGHAVGLLAPGGWVCRTDPEGRKWELVASGMRNAYDIAFDARGELFTFDSDMEWDVGLPWYRPTRVLHLVPGAEFGWRNGSGKWPAHSPDSWPAVVDVGLGSPTGIEFAPETWPADLAGQLLIADWAYGQVFAVDLQPAGASYTGNVRPFLEGKPFPVTDLTVQGDSLYLTTGGRRVQSGLYRVTPKVASAVVEAASKVPAKNASPTPAVALRHELEELHGEETGVPIEIALGHLTSADPFLRRAARTVLEHQPVQTWQARVLELEDPDGIIQGGIALCRTADPSPELARQLFAGWLALPFKELDLADRLDALRWFALIHTRLAEPNEAERRAVAETLDPLFPSGIEELDRELCRVLVSVEAPFVVKRGLQRLDQGATPESRIFYFYALAHSRGGWDLAGREAYFRTLQLAIRDFEGGASLTQYLQAIRDLSRKQLTPELDARLSPYLTNLPQPAATPSRLRRFVKSWTPEDLQGKALVLEERNLARGRRLIDEATCLSCHRFGGRGGNTGPDLAGVGNRFNRLDLLQAILEPSAQISDQYQDTELLTNDDDFYVGLLEGEEDGQVLLRTLPPENELLRFARDEIAELKLHPYSRMPTALLDSFDEEEVLDLLAALIAGPGD